MIVTEVGGEKLYFTSTEVPISVIESSLKELKLPTHTVAT